MNLKNKYIAFWVNFILLWCMFFSGVSYAAEDDSILILYDSKASTGWVGYLNSIFLANLTARFSRRTYDIVPMEQYTKGLLKDGKYRVTFYLGTYYNNPLPKYFLEDALSTKKALVWFNYNLWQLIDAQPNFSQQYGFKFDYIDQTEYDQVWYKNTILSKNTRNHEVGRISITDASKAEISAVAKKSGTNLSAPYIIHSSNIWYVADIPFTYISENDRYLAFADVLFDIFQNDASTKKRALLVLKDISPIYDTILLKRTADYLFSKKVPFGISLTPYYNDPLGYYTHGVPTAIELRENPEFVTTIKYMISKGGTLMMNGYTHQYGNEANPHTGVSGDDYEFFKVMLDPNTNKIITVSPTPEDSIEWVKERVGAAWNIMQKAGLPTVSIWQTPMYIASDVDNQYFASKFSAIFGRVTYYDKDDKSHYAGQFYPYVITKDRYGKKVIPENLGAISPIPWFSAPIRTVDDIVQTAKINLVVRDAWASMYYHPYLGLDYLEDLISSIEALGYDFVSLSSDLK